MTRIRTIKPEIWDDERFGTLSLLARLVFIGLITQADDEGRIRGNPGFVRGRLFSYNEDVSVRDIDAALDEMSDANMVTRYQSVDGKQLYLQLRSWSKHQRIQRPTPSTMPPPGKHAPITPRNTSHAGNSDTPPRALHEASCTEGKGTEWNGVERSGSSNPIIKQRDKAVASTSPNIPPAAANRPSPSFDSVEEFEELGKRIAGPVATSREHATKELHQMHVHSNLDKRQLAYGCKAIIDRCAAGNRPEKWQGYLVGAARKTPDDWKDQKIPERQTVDSILAAWAVSPEDRIAAARAESEMAN